MRLPSLFCDNHPLFTQAKQLNTICKPLQLIGINYFSYQITQESGERSRLCTDPSWMTQYYTKGYYQSSVFEDEPTAYSPAAIPWHWLKQHPIYDEAALYGLKNGITIVIPGKKSCEFFEFAMQHHVESNPQIMMEQLGLLYHFINYFREKAKELLASAAKNTFRLPAHPVHSYLNTQIALYKSNNIDEFIKSTEMAHQEGTSPEINNFLTKKEHAIMKYLTQGHTTKTIAATLSRSSRTVEEHINNIKDKCGCKTLFQLGFVANQNLNVAG